MRARFALLMRSRLISGGVWALSGRVAVALASLAINALLARLLSPDEMGVYFIAITWVAIAALIAQLGLGHAVIRLLGEALNRSDGGAARGTVASVMRLGMVGAIAMGALTYTAPGHWAAENLFRSPLMTAVLGATALVVFLTSLQNLFAEILRGFHDIPRATLAGGMFASLAFAALLGLQMVLDGQTTLRFALWSNVIALLVSVLFGGYWVIRALAPLPRAKSVSHSALLGLTGPMLLITVCSLLLMQADLWILGMFRPQTEVAIYGAASRLAATLWMINGILAAVLPPLIARQCARNEIPALQRLMRAAATASALAALPIVAAFAVFPSEILGLIYGTYYAQGAAVLAFLSIGWFANIFLGMRGYVLLMSGHERSLMRIMLVSAGLNLVLCTIAARFGTISTVALASMTAMVLSGLLETWLLRKTMRMWTLFSVRSINTVQRHILRYLSPDNAGIESPRPEKKPS